MRLQSKTLLHARYLGFLLWEFRWPLGVFWAIVFFGGLGLKLGYHERPLGYAEACHCVFLLIFLEFGLSFPEEWYLQPFLFLIPIFGLGAVADSVVRLAYLVFTRKSNLPEWQRMVASLHRDHVVVVGIGKVGLLVIKGLAALGEAVVAVERQKDSRFLDEVHDLGVPVILGDGRQRRVLEQANVAAAQAIILATDDDLANLDSGLTAREVNPKIRVVLRLFDETLATRVAGTFGMPAISTSQVAAPAFIAAATGRTVYQDFDVGGQTLQMVDLALSPAGGLAGGTVGEIESQRHVSVVMHRGAAGVKVSPPRDLMVCAGDTVFVIGTSDRLRALEAANRPAAG